MKISKAIFILLNFICICKAYFLGGFWGSLGVGAVCFVLYDFFTQNKSWIPIGELASLIGGIQWIISPFFSYSLADSVDSVDSVYGMSQSCDIYMKYTVSMYIAFIFGYYLFRKSVRLSREDLIQYCKPAKKISNILIGIGFVFLILPIHTSSLLFIKTLASYLFFIGFIFRMYIHPDQSTLYLLISLGIQFINSIRSGMFHELLIWGIFMFVTWFNINQTPVKKRIIYFVISFCCVFVLQTVKASYREFIWNSQYSGSKIELFFSLLCKNVVNINEAKSDNEETTIARYNQGWIISRIYDNVPKNHDYFYGRTYADALVSSLIPRFLVPDKKGSGAQSREDFIEMTGYPLSKGTSMGLSILGESYGNFGLFGGSIFMFLWGFFIAKIIAFIDKLSLKDYLWIMFLPIICFNIIKAEISMMSVLNWTVKSIIFVYIVIFALRVITKKRIYS